MEDNQNIWEQMSNSMKAIESDYEDCLEFLRNKEAASSEEEIALATVAATLTRFRDATLNASEMVATCTTMLALCDPTEMGLDFVHEYSNLNENSRMTMEAILIMINLAIQDIEGED
jgi:hypothetical protein